MTTIASRGRSRQCHLSELWRATGPHADPIRYPPGRAEMTPKQSDLIDEHIAKPTDWRGDLEQLAVGLDHVRESPRELGKLEMIACRPAVDDRLELQAAELDVRLGVVLDSWSTRGSSPNAKSQVTVMNARAAQLVAGDRSRWSLAGDQLYVDLDLSAVNLPAGTRLAIGSAVIEVTDQPHLGCLKFTARFGAEARELVNSPEGTAMNLRGINTRVVKSGTVHVGDEVRKLRSDGA